MEGRCEGPADIFGNLNVYDLMTKDLFLYEKDCFLCLHGYRDTTAFELIYVKYFF